MNQGRIWCVVSPTVGLPLFLGAVALTSLAVHASVMTHTTWMSNYWQGNSKDKPVASVASPVAVAGVHGDSPYSVTVTPVAGNGAVAPASFVITVTPSAAKPGGLTTADAGSVAPATENAAIGSASAN